MLFILQPLRRMVAYTPFSVWLMCACMLGIATEASRISWLISGAGITLLGELLTCYHYYPRMVAWATLLCCLYCGAWRMSSQATQRLSTLQHIPRGKCAITGTVLNKQPTGNPHYPHRLTLSVVAITARTEKKYFNPPISITLDLAQDESLCTYGTLVTVSDTVIFTQPSEHFALYYAKNGIVCGAKTTKTSTLVMQEQALPSLARWWHTTRNNVLNNAMQQFSTQTFMLISTMFFGYTPAHESAQYIRELFSWWGLSHLLARSGLHLMMFLLFIAACFTTIPVPFSLKQLLTVILIMIYTCMSWPSVSFMRAVSMMLMYSACLVVYSAPHTLHIISCVALATLWYQPLYLFSLDFQLSFALTFTLAIIRHANKVRNII